MNYDFDIACPKCGTLLHAKNEWIGKVARCNACQHQLTITGKSPAPPVKVSAPSTQPKEAASRPDEHGGAGQWYYARDGQQSGPVSESDLRDFVASGRLGPSDLVWKPGMGSWASVQETLIAPGIAHVSTAEDRRPGPVWAPDLVDLFSGKEKEDVFQLLPGETVLDDFTIRQSHLWIIRRGISRVTLTSHRVLYTATRVFSPAYWLLVVLFPPLMLYYAVRISFNRNVSMALSSVDSVEKRYYPNWLLFILATLAAFLAAFLCAAVIVLVLQSYPASSIVYSLILGLAAAGTLILLLKTRMVGIDVRSGNNQFSVRFNAGDFGLSEAKLDAFVQRLCEEVDRAKPLGKQAEQTEPR